MGVVVVGCGILVLWCSGAQVGIRCAGFARVVAIR